MTNNTEDYLEEDLFTNLENASLLLKEIEIRDLDDGFTAEEIRLILKTFCQDTIDSC